MWPRVLPPLAAFLFLALLLFSLGPARASSQSSTSPLFLALGDSLAFGVGADSPENDGYVRLVADTLRAERFAETGLDLVNVSAPGAETEDLLGPGGQLERAVAEIRARSGDSVEGNEAAVIAVSAGANDLLALAEPGDACIENAGSELCRTEVTETLATVQNNLTEALTALRREAPAAEIYVTNVYNPYSGTGEDVEIIASVGVQQLNGVISVATAVETVRAQLVPIFELFQGRAGQWIAEDEIHPNNDGYRVIAEAVLAKIEGRAVSIPEDLRALPAETPVPTVVNENGIKPIVFWIALPLALLAGAALSAVYFFMRGRA